jgi:hypothetical protein
MLRVAGGIRGAKATRQPHLNYHHAGVEPCHRCLQRGELRLSVVEKKVKGVHAQRAPVRHPQRQKVGGKVVEHRHHGKVAGWRLRRRAQLKYRRHLSGPVVRYADGKRRGRRQATRGARRAQLAGVVRAAPNRHRFVVAVNVPVTGRKCQRRRAGHLNHHAQQGVVKVGAPLKVAAHQHNAARATAAC